MSSEKKFPDTIESFAKGLCKLCRKHKFYNFDGEFTPSSFHNKDCTDWDQFKFSWDSGRHEVKSRQIIVMAKRSMRLEVKED